MSELNYYSKYLKYKNKYINLKNQTGGANNPDLSLGIEGRAENQGLQDKVRVNMILDSRNGKRFDQIDTTIYEPILNNLMKKLPNPVEGRPGNEEINFDFLNLLSAFPLGPYKDVSIFDIVTDASDVGFKFKNDLRYEIDKLLAGRASGESKTGGGDFIFRLTRKTLDRDKRTEVDKDGYPKHLVLKLFDLTGSDYKNYSPLNINEVYEGAVGGIPGYDERYKAYDIDTFNTISLDEHYNQYFIEETRRTKIYLSCGLDNYQNEIAQNLIIKNILNGTRHNDNLIKYYNFFYNQINFGLFNGGKRSYGCILMEEIETTLYHLLIHDIELVNNDGFKREFQLYLNALGYLKTNTFRFNHTDLKSQNVFMRKDGKLLIADLDKSSITYNKIRFFNNQWLSKSIDYATLSAKFQLLDNSDPNLLKINESSVRKISGIELEEMIFRYNQYPMIPFFDFLSLFCEIKILTISGGDDFLKTFSEEIFDRFIDSDQKLMELTKNVKRSVNRIDHSNFGDIIFNTLIMNGVSIPKKTKIIINDDNSVIQHLTQNVKLLTETWLPTGSRTKLALTPQLTITDQTNTNFRVGFYSTEWTCTTSEIEDSMYTILYTGNYDKEKYKDKTIVKVNRFGKRGIPPLIAATYLFEFMELP
jgi:hypothetical protein